MGSVVDAMRRRRVRREKYIARSSGECTIHRQLSFQVEGPR